MCDGNRDLPNVDICLKIFHKNMQKKKEYASYSLEFIIHPS